MKKILVWHIDRARFEFSDPSEIEEWQKTKQVNFEFSPSESDDGGESVFVDPANSGDYFSVTPDKGELKIEIEESAVVISAWVKVEAEVVDDLDEDILGEWEAEYAGHACATIDLGDADAYITEDDGGDWRILD